jgi:hypothetical protein
MALPDSFVDTPSEQGMLGSRFFTFCSTEPASLHAIMLLAAAQFRHVRGSEAMKFNTLNLRQYAMDNINAALRDSLRSTSDQLIAAVALLATYEVAFGGRDYFGTHMVGLSRMISIRGGLPQLGLEGLLERILFYIDVNTARMTGGHLVLDPTTLGGRYQHPQPDVQRFFGGLRVGPPR